MKIIYVDVDETICNTPEDRDYTKSTPIKEHINKINKLYDEGNMIIYWTARGSRSKINWYELTKTQLTNWDAKHHELRVDKPYYDCFIDDKCILISHI